VRLLAVVSIAVGWCGAAEKPAKAAASADHPAPSNSNVEQPVRCTDSATRPTLSLAIDSVQQSDTTVRVGVCLAIPSGTDVGSLRGVLTFDGSALRMLGTTSTRGGALAINTQRPGVVEFAGASPGGMTAGELLTVTLRLAAPGRVPALRLDVPELNAISGASLVTTARVASVGPTDCVVHAEQNLRLTSLTPTSAEAGAIATVTLVGCGFDDANNTVLFGPAQVRGVRSTNGGTRIQFAAPTEVRTSPEVPPMQLEAGTYPVSVRTARGVSNVILFTLR
jgi:hypothetical protein